MSGVWIRRAPANEPFDPRMDVGTFECPVCYDVLRSTDVAIVTSSCGHRFCRACFKDILRTSMTCPWCRHALLKEKTHASFPPSKRLGLFVLNSTFFAVPGSTVLLRVFEPRYLLLVQQCIETDTVFGLQAGLEARRGVLVSVRRHRMLPEGHIIMEGLVVGRYEAFDSFSHPEVEENSYNLYRMKSSVVDDKEEVVDEAEIRALTEICDMLFKKRLSEMSRFERETLKSVCGNYPSSASTSEFAFWLLGALSSPTPKVNVLFSQSLAERLRFCAKLLEDDQPFECLMEQQ